MNAHIVFLMLTSAAILAAQNAPAQLAEPQTRTESNVVERTSPRRCSIPLLAIRPKPTVRMPIIQPPVEFVSKRFFIEPPAPPCEEPQPNPVISQGEARKAKPQEQ